MLSGALKITNSLEDAMTIYLKVSNVSFRFIEPLYSVILLDVLRESSERLMVEAVLSKAIALSISSSLSRKILVKINSSYFDKAKELSNQIMGYSLMTALSDVICIETFVEDFDEVVDFVKSVRVLGTQYGINKHGYPYITGVRVQKTNSSMPLTIKFSWLREYEFDMMSKLGKSLRG